MATSILQIVILIPLLYAVCNGATNSKPSGDCKSAMNLVKTYLESSKVELLKNIEEAKAQRCKARTWRKVDLGRVAHFHVNGATKELKNDASQGLRIKVTVTPQKCKDGSYFTIHFKGRWTQIMYTQRFLGNSRCWNIFGKESKVQSRETAGLEQFSPSMGDVIFGQVRMKSKTEHIYDGRNGRCDDDSNNFWHKDNGDKERKATVILRRSPNSKHGGISTHTSCEKATYFIEDIYVLE